jgi:hypothetical protein
MNDLFRHRGGAIVVADVRRLRAARLWPFSAGLGYLLWTLF